MNPTDRIQPAVKKALARSLAMLVAAFALLGGWLFFVRSHLARPSVAEVRVRVHVGLPVATVGPDFDGVNLCALWNDAGDDPGAVKAFDAMHQRLIRFPGGVPAEWYDWEHPLASGWTQLTPDKVWKMASGANARLIFQTNAATDRVDTNKKTGAKFSFDSSGAHAAGWAKSAKAGGMDIAYWEIGNEPEMDAPQAAKATQQSIYAWYDAKFAEQAKAIKTANPSAKIMGPASANTWYWQHEHNLDKFLEAEGNRTGSGLVDAISVHWYPGGGDGPWEKTCGLAQQWAPAILSIRDAISRNDSRDLPIYVTEWNFGGGMKNDSASTLGNALGCADCLAMFHQTGVAGETFFTLQHIKTGWGVLATRKDSKPLNDPSPTYFALKMASHLYQTAVKVDCGADPANDLSAYATTDGHGNVAVMLINKTGITRTVPISFPDYSPAGNAQVYTLSGANDRVTDNEIIYNGRPWSGWTAGLTLPASKPASGVYSMHPYSLMVIVFRNHT